MCRRADEDVSEVDGGKIMGNSTEYFISCFGSIYDNKYLTENEFHIIKDKSKRIAKLLNEIDYYPLVLMNCQEFNRYCETTLQQGDDDFISINRLFSNLVNSFYMWIGYNERHYDTVFKKLKSGFYDNDFCYRFLYNIRNYTAHNSLPIKHITTDVLKDKVDVFTKVTDLTEKDSGISGKFRDELIKMNIETVNVYDVTSDFVTAFGKWQIDLWNAIKPALDNDILAINKIIPISTPWFINTYIESSDYQTSVPIGHQIKYLADKSKLHNYNFLSCLSQNA